MRVASVAAILLLPMLLGFVRGPETALNAVYLTHGSSIRIDGTSTVSTFSCSTSDVGGGGTLDPISGELEIFVRSFDCGIRRMNIDFRDALKAGDHEFIRFSIRDAKVVEPAGPGGWTTLQARGTILLAGVTREITVRAEANRLGPDTVNLRGSHRLAMSEFGVSPPTKLLGMVRAHDNITVEFNLIANGS